MIDLNGDSGFAAFMIVAAICATICTCVYIVWGWRIKKLTVEQADYLIEQFNIVHNNLMLKPAGGMFHIMDCRALIENCTEKPFPEFELNIEHDESLHFDHREYNNEEYIYLHTESCENGMSIETFKEFVSGCNKIVEWLDGQDSK